MCVSSFELGMLWMPLSNISFQYWQKWEHFHWNLNFRFLRQQNDSWYSWNNKIFWRFVSLWVLIRIKFYSKKKSISFRKSQLSRNYIQSFIRFEFEFECMDISCETETTQNWVVARSTSKFRFNLLFLNETSFKF